MVALSPNSEPDRETRQARIRAHRVFDQIWKRKLARRRCDAYKWLRKALGLTRKQGHLSLLTVEQCELLITRVYRDFPQLRTRYSRLLYEDLFDDADED